MTMTQEDKQLLLREIAARITYDVVCDYDGSLLTGIDKIDVTEEVVYGNLTAWYDAWPIEKCKPYLRKLSSMTKEENIELNQLNCWEDGRCWCSYDRFRECLVNNHPALDDEIYIRSVSKVIDFLNQHHFDYCGLIDKGLAIEATESMYVNH